MTVRLRRIDAGDIRDGRIVGGEIVTETTTGADGQYGLRMPNDTDPGTCRFVMEVGRDRTLTRAFVAADRVDVSFESEATVRLVLDEIKAGRTTLCGLDAGELRSIDEAVAASDNQVFGDTAAAVNASAVVAAASDPNVRAALDAATGQPTPRPSATDTAPPTLTATAPPPTATATAPLPPTRTNTPAATRTATGTGVPTNTGAPTRTDTAAPTRTNTPAATNTALATATSVPTNTAVATATTVPTNTALATATAIPTNTVAPSATATLAPSATPAPPTATFTATATLALPQVNLGVVAGTAGFAVDVPVTLTTNGAAIAAVSTDIEFDADVLAVEAGTGVCTVDARLAGVKEVVSRVAAAGAGRQVLRVGLIGLDNNQVISSGPIFTCRFTVASDASGSTTLLNAPEAAGQQAQPIAVGGADGRIDIAAAAATLGLLSGTSAAVGDTVAVTGALSSRELAIAAVATDIRFPADRLRAASGAGGVPDCSLDPDIAALGKTLVAAALPEAGGLAGVRVGVVGLTTNTALPDDEATPVFACRFVVLSGGGGAIALSQSAEGASPAAQPVGLSSPPGMIPVP